MISHVHLSSSCSFANDISDHYPIFLFCNKNLSDGFNKPKKTFNGLNIFVILKIQIYYLTITFLF